MTKFKCLLLTLFIFTSSKAQKRESVYLNTADSTAHCYIVLHPPTTSFTGFLFLIPGMFQNPDEVLKQTDLPLHAARQGIFTIIPTFKTGVSSFGVDSSTQASLLELIHLVIGKYKLEDKRFFIGGFSIGGSCALKYAELAIRFNYPIKPVAVFAIDAPLDFERMYNTIERELRLPGTGNEILEENLYLRKRLLKEFGGSPAQALRNFYKISPYSFSDTTHHAIQPLVKLPIRLYTEPDIQWWLEEGADYSGMNAFDFAAMTNELRRMGNKNIQLITTSNSGLRKPENKKHPHSWSIAEPENLVKWLLHHGSN